jgi:hypothetical protein
MIRDTTKQTLCPLVSVLRQPDIKKNRNPYDCDYFKPTTMWKASPELSAQFRVTAQGSTHVTARKLAAISFPWSVVDLMLDLECCYNTAGGGVARPLRIRCVAISCSCKRHKVRKCTQVIVFCSKLILPLRHVKVNRQKRWLAIR